MFAFSLEGNYGDFIEESSPTGSALGSWRWETDAGEFGILGSFVYSQVKSRADRFQVSNFADRVLYSSGDVIDTGGGETPVQDVIFPRGAVMGSQEFFGIFGGPLCSPNALIASSKYSAATVFQTAG